MLLVVLKTIFLFPYLLFKHSKDKLKRGTHLYGIYGFYGLAGKGKTIAMCKKLRDYRKQYGDKIYIMTNFCYDDEDFSLTSWQDLLKQYDKPVVVAYDEIVNEFNSREYKDFPIQLFSVLTQLRKGNGMQILYTAQRWHFVDKNFRSLSFGCYECSTILSNLTVAKLYDPVDYDHLMSNSDYDKRMKIHPKLVYSFLQNEDLRNCYDSYKMLESAKTKQYMDRQELAQIYTLSN